MSSPPAGHAIGYIRVSTTSAPSGRSAPRAPSGCGRVRRSAISSRPRPGSVSRRRAPASLEARARTAEAKKAAAELWSPDRPTRDPETGEIVGGSWEPAGCGRAFASFSNSHQVAWGRGRALELVSAAESKKVLDAARTRLELRPVETAVADETPSVASRALRSEPIAQVIESQDLPEAETHTGALSSSVGSAVVVVLRSRKGTWTCELRLPSGELSVDGTTYRSPSAAAKALVGGERNGWRDWRTVDGARIATLRRSA